MASPGDLSNDYFSSVIGSTILEESHIIKTMKKVRRTQYELMDAQIEIFKLKFSSSEIEIMDYLIRASSVLY